MRISDWSSDVCSSDLAGFAAVRALVERRPVPAPARPVALSPSAAGALPGEAIVVNRHGGPEQLHLAPIQAPRPGPGEVRLRQTAIGVNFIDVYCRAGTFALLRPPGVPGMEADRSGEGRVGEEGVRTCESWWEG